MSTSIPDQPMELVTPNGVVWTLREIGGEVLYAPAAVAQPQRWVMETAESLVAEFGAAPADAAVAR